MTSAHLVHRRNIDWGSQNMNEWWTREERLTCNDHMFDILNELLSLPSSSSTCEHIKIIYAWSDKIFMLGCLEKAANCVLVWKMMMMIMMITVKEKVVVQVTIQVRNELAWYVSTLLAVSIKINNNDDDVITLTTGMMMMITIIIRSLFKRTFTSNINIHINKNISNNTYYY